MLAATVAAVYFFLRWTDEDSWFFYCLALFATALACLLKLTALYLGLPLLWLVWQKWGRQTLVRWQFWLFGIVVALVLLLWYGHAYQLGQEFGASFHILTSAGTDKWGTWRLLVDPAFYHQVFVGNLGGRMLTWAGYRSSSWGCACGDKPQASVSSMCGSWRSRSCCSWSAAAATTTTTTVCR